MRRSRLIWLAVPLTLATLVAPGGSNAASRTNQVPLDLLRPGFQGEDSLAPGDFDARVGALRPTSAQLAHARRLGASKPRWTKFGTPQSLYNRHGYLSGPSEGDAVEVARRWVRDNASLFRLTPELTEAKYLDVTANHAMFEAPDRRRIKAGLKPLASEDSLPHIVLFRQLFLGVAAGQDGLLTVGLDSDNRVTYVSSSATGDTEVTNKRTLDPVTAWRNAAADVGWHVPAGDITVLDKRSHIPGAVTLQVAGQPEPQLVRPMALPTPRDGVKLTWVANTLDNARVDKGHEPLAYMTHVDAQTGKVLHRAHAVDHLAHGMPTKSPGMQVEPNPRWKAFPHSPALPMPGVASPDDRPTWCWVSAASGCDLVTGGSEGIRAIPQLRFPYDELPAPDGSTAEPTFTSQGNNAWTTSSYASHLTPDSPRYATPSPTRVYDYAFTDQWHTSNCNLSANYASPAQNDIDAAINNLFFSYGRVHDWSYFLGFMETAWNMQQVNFGEDREGDDEARANDPEKGQAQAGAVAGSVVFTGRDNANQITLNDGTPGVTNQYLWHPLQASFYAPCTDGAYDMGIIVHEYGHAISNRMVGGPDEGLPGGSSEGGKMGEAWSDLMAMEYANGYGFAPKGDENPYAVAVYATGNKQAGIRNYGMNDSPLNYSQLLYDGNGQTSPHSDSEIWGATNFVVRQALVDKYDDQFPYDNKKLQYECADGRIDSAKCPGNRRWIQLLFDGYLLQAANASMPEAAEAQIAADKMRYKGANQKELWAAYAARGMGDNADVGGTADWATPLENIEAQVRFRAVPVDGGGVPAEALVFVGPFTARTSEAEVSKSGEFSNVRQFVPGNYFFTARADGFGMYQFERTFEAGKSYIVDVPMRRNLASETSGGDATGDGGNHAALIDDSEETNWAYRSEMHDNDTEIAGKQVTVDLAGGAHLVKEIAVSALNRPQATSDPYDDIGQNRFAALRSFEILTCDASKGADCEEADSFQLVYTSPEDAFPSIRPRPTSENLRIKTFDVPDTQATHVRIRVLTNHCTGNPAFSGEQNPVGEPLSDPDCVDGFTAATLTTPPNGEPDEPPAANNSQKGRVRISELQVFSSVTPGKKDVTPPPPQPPRPPVVNPPVGQPPVGQPPVAQPPRIPTTGASPVLPALGLVLAAASAYALRRRRTA
ncbi:MAG TPA: M36 family metallopeptidase [Frankiaceae bacterium]|nr:M36 family metallopeptidase [Frankiaceae bacterium]